MTKTDKVIGDMLGELEAASYRIQMLEDLLRDAESALEDLGACSDPECREPRCRHVLPRIEAALKETT